MKVSVCRLFGILFNFFLLLPFSGQAQKKQTALKSKDSALVVSLLNKSLGFDKIAIDSAFFYANEALTVSKQRQYPMLLGKTYRRLGVLYRKIGELDSALLYQHTSLGYCNNYGDSLCMAETWHNMGLIARQKGEYSEALELELKCIRLFEKYGETKNLSKVYNSLGNIYSIQENWSEAIEFYYKGLNIQSEVLDEPTIARLQYNIGVNHYYNNELDLADSMLQHSLVIAIKINNKVLQANVFHSLGVIYQNNEKYNKAKSYFGKAAQLQEEMEDKEGEIFTLLSLGELFDFEKQWSKSEENYKKALQLALYTGLKEEELLAREKLIVAFQKQEKNREALQQWQKFDELKELLREESTGEKLLELQEKFETEQKEKKNQLLARENQLQENELKIKNEKLFNRNLSITALLLVVVLFFLLLYNYRRRTHIERIVAKQKAEQNQEEILNLLREQELIHTNALLEGQESERKRIAADLHDGLSNMMVTVKLYFENLQEKLSDENNEVKKKYAEAVSMLDELCQKARTIAHDMSIQAVASDFKTGLQKMIATVNNSDKIKTELSTFGIEQSYGIAFENNVFYIIRELIGNALKHSDAQKLYVQLTDDKEYLTIIVEDNGKGFILEEQTKKGLGFTNLKNRLQPYNGTLDIDTRVGRGTSITIEIPLQSISNISKQNL